MPVIPQRVLLLRSDGTVACAKDAPRDWLDRPLSELPVPRDVKEAALELLNSFDGRNLAHTTVASAPAATTLMVHESIPLRRSVVRVAGLAMRVLEVFATQAKSARVTLKVHLAPHAAPVLHGDEEKLAWALVTLVGNALRVVTQATRADEDAVVSLNVDWSAGEETFYFTVTDTGPGMSAETARYLFDRNPRTGRPAGLALLMVRDVAVAHKGNIAVESQLGGGTRFTLRVPRGRPS